MEWRIENEENLEEAPGYLVTIAEYDDDENPTGAVITVPCAKLWDGEKVSEEKAIENILRSLFARLRKYLGHEFLPLSGN
jgi:hypothetical protein